MSGARNRRMGRDMSVEYIQLNRQATSPVGIGLGFGWWGPCGRMTRGDGLACPAESGETPIHQSRNVTIAPARRLAAENYRDDSDTITLGRGNKVIARRADIAGLDTVGTVVAA